MSAAAFMDRFSPRWLISRPVRAIPLLLIVAIFSLFYFSVELPLVLKEYLPSTVPPVQAQPQTPSPATKDTDWSRFAYAQYVTNSPYLCNSVMFFAALNTHDSHADRILMYPANMMSPTETNPSTEEARILVQARDQYKVKLIPIDVQHRHVSDATWADSYTKLLVFNQTNYDRVLSVDSDSLLMQHMDELFLLPPSPLAIPRAYWLKDVPQVLSSQIMLVTPSEREMERVDNAINNAPANDYDMEIVNQLYGDSAVIIPHRPYDMLSAEFRGTDHIRYLGSAEEKWDPLAEYNRAKLIHFSDWPVAKPWLSTKEAVLKNHEPKCPEGQNDCIDRQLWYSLYEEFRTRRKNVCGAGF